MSDPSRDPWGENFDWARLGRRSDEKIRAMRAGAAGSHADPHRDLRRDLHRDLDVYAAALGLAVRLYRPLALIGRVVNYGVAVTLLAGAAWSLWMLVDHGREPVDFLETRVLTEGVRPGGSIDVRFDINRRRICQVDPDYAIIGHDAQGNDNHKFTFAAQHLDVGGPLGHDPFVRSFTLPKELVAGEARFRVAWSWVCHLNYVDLIFPRQSEVRDGPFTIRP